MLDALDNIPTFDESALAPLHELQVEGEPSFVGGLIVDYLAQVEALSEKILSLENQKDSPALERAAHQLKSSSAVLGLARLAALCLAIENGVRSNKPTADSVLALAGEVGAAITQLKLYLARL